MRMKKILSLLLALAMVMTLAPSWAVAEEKTPATELPGPVGGVITLTSDVVLSSTYVVPEDVTRIDGQNQYTITSSATGDGAILVKTNGVTIENLTVSGPNTTSIDWDNGEYGIKVYNAEDVILNGVTVTKANAGILVDSSDVTLKGAINVSGNEFGGIEVCKSENDTLGAGELTIADGATVTCTDNNVPAIWIDGLDEDAGTVTNSGSTVLRKVVGTGNKGEQIYFWTTGNVAAIGNVGYATLAAAVAAAESGDTVTLLDNVDLGSEKLTVPASKAITVDGNGKQISFSGDRVFNTMTGTTSLTVKNTTFQGSGLARYVAVTNGNYSGSVSLDKCEFNNLLKCAVIMDPNGETEAKLSITNCKYSNTPLGYSLNMDYKPSQKLNIAVTYTDNTGVSTEFEVFKEAVVIGSNGKFVKQYDLAEAIAAATSGQTVKLLKDVTLTQQLKIDKAITLDGAGKIITRAEAGGDKTENAAILVTAGATIKNLTVSGPNTTIRSGDDGWDEGEFGIKFYQATGATLSGVTVTAANAGIQVNGGSVTMTGTIDVSNNEFGGIELCHGGALNISAATLKNDNETEACPVLWNDDTKGTIVGGENLVKVQITGEDKDHYYLTAPAVAVAKIGTKSYETLKAAIAAVQNNETIELLDNVTTGGIVVDTNKTFTVDFKGHTLTFDGLGAGSTGTTTQGFQVKVGQNVTFKNGTINCSEANAAMTWDTSLTNPQKGIAWIINNYATLTLDKMTIDGTNVAHNGTTVRNVVNNYAGTINVINGSVITATGSDFAINAYYYNKFYTENPAYTAPVTNITDSIINGKVEAISGTVKLNGTTVVNGQVRVGENRTYIDKQPGASGAMVTIGKDAKVTLAEYPVVVFGADTLNVYGTVESTSESSTDTAAVSTVGNSWNAGSVINVYDGAVITSKKCSAIYMPNGALTITGGTITGPTAVYFKSTSLSISGGTLTGNGVKADYVFNGNGCNPTGDALVVDNCKYPSGINTPVITDGTFISEHAAAVGSYKGNGADAPLTGFIIGGTFSSNVKDYVAEGYVATQNGTTWTVAAKAPEVEVTTEVKVDDVVATPTEGKVAVTGFAADDDDTDKPTATEAAEAITAVLNNTAVTTFDKTGIEDATNVDDIVTKVAFKNASGETVTLEEEDKATITTKISIVPKAATVEKADTTVKVTKLTFDVKPMAYATTTAGEVSAEFTPTQAITFRLPVPSYWTAGAMVEVTHRHGNTPETKYAYVEGTGENLYVELESATFSEWDLLLATEDPVATVNGKPYPLSKFQDAIDASSQANPVVLLQDISAEDLNFEDSEGAPCLIKLTKDVYVDRGADSQGDKFVLSQNWDEESTGYVIFVNEQTDKKIVAVTSTTPSDLTDSSFYIEDPISVDIKLLNKEDDSAVTKVAGYYVEVQISEYVTMAETGNDGWDQVPNETGKYCKFVYNIPSDTTFDNGTLCTLSLVASASTVTDGGDEIVKVTKAYIVDDVSEAMSGVVISLGSDSITNATAKIKPQLMVTFELSNNGVFTYDGNAFGVDSGDYTIKYSVDKGDTYTIVAANYISAAYTNTSAANIAPKNVGNYTVTFTVSIPGYSAVTSDPMSFTIAQAELTITPNAAKSGDDFFVYSGKTKTLLTANTDGKLYSVTGLTESDAISGTVAFESKSDAENTYSAGYERFEKGTYSVRSKAITIKNGDEDVTGNYNIIYANVTVRIEYPEIEYAVTEYITGYDMLYVFVPKDEDGAVARVTYNNNKFYDVTAFGYECLDGTHVQKKTANSSFDGKVYALLVAGNVDFSAHPLQFVKYNDKLAATITLSSEGANDVNGSKFVDLADAVAVAATYRADASVTAKLSSYMATILRADVDRNGVVELVNTTDDNLIGDAALIKDWVTTH